MSPNRHHTPIDDKTRVSLSFATWCAIIGAIVYFTFIFAGVYHGLCKRLDSKMDLMEHSLWVTEARKRTHLDLPYDSEIIYKRQHPEETEGQSQ